MSSVNFYSDPTHKRAFTSQDVRLLSIRAVAPSSSVTAKTRFELLACEYDSEESLTRRIHRWVLDWANRNKEHYESRFAFVYPLYKSSLICEL